MSASKRKQTPKGRLRSVAADFQIDEDLLDFSNSRRLGSGAFASVMTASYHGHEVAVKRLRNSVGAQAEEEFLKEVQVLAKLRFPTVLSLIGWARTNAGNLLIITEYMRYGTLKNIIHDRDAQGNFKHQLNLIEVLSYAQSICSGMAYLHGTHIIHRDLKPENILIADTTSCSVKVADFGMGRLMEPKKSSTHLEVAQNQNPMMTPNTGTPVYAAPEISTRNYTTKADVYSFGVILWEMYCRDKPWKDIQWAFEVAKMVDSGKRPPLPKSMPEWLQTLITTTWHSNPEKRPSFQYLANRFKSHLREAIQKRDEQQERSQLVEKLSRLGITTKNSDPLSHLQALWADQPAEKKASVSIPSSHMLQDSSSPSSSSSPSIKSSRRRKKSHRKSRKSRKKSSKTKSSGETEPTKDEKCMASSSAAELANAHISYIDTVFDQPMDITKKILLAFSNQSQLSWLKFRAYLNVVSSCPTDTIDRLAHILCKPGQQGMVVQKEIVENFLRWFPSIYAEAIPTDSLSPSSSSELRTNLPTLSSIAKEIGHDWFFGFISGGEAVSTLANKPKGTFMFRFSSNGPGMYALSLKDAQPNPVLHWRIVPSDRGGFTIDSSHYDSILSIYQTHKTIPLSRKNDEPAPLLSHTTKKYPNMTF